MESSMGEQRTTAKEVIHAGSDKLRDEKYNQYVKEKTPKPNLPLDMAKAFLTGGIICTIGQGLTNLYMSMGAEKEAAASYSTISLVFLAIVLTGFHIFPKIAKFGGAGSVVPITGFANSVAAPAIEFQKEGQVFGIGCKIFTIAGPVILYGIFSSWVLGLIYWGGICLGIW